VIVRGETSDVPPAGKPFSAVYGNTFDDAAASVPHGQVRSTTVGDIPNTGGSAELSPQLTRAGNLNERHGNVCLGNGDCPFGELTPNPIPKGGRLQ
jgi:hypothetical protein